MSARTAPTVIYAVLVILIIVAGVVGYFAGQSAAAGGVTTTTVTETKTVTHTETKTVTQTVTVTGPAPTTSPSPTPTETTTTPPTTTTTTTPVQLPSKLTFVEIGKGVHPYWSVVEAGMKMAEKEIEEKYGIEINAIFWTPTREEAALQLQGFDTYIAQGVDGIAIAPVDPVSAAPYIEKAIEQGIPVITFDTDAPESARLCYIGTGNYRAGYLAGTAAYMLAKEKGYIKPGATVKVGIITATLAALNAYERVQGFKDALMDNAKADPDIQGNIEFQFIGPYEDKGDPAAAVNFALSILQSHPDLHIAFGSNAYEGPAWAEALKQLGYEPGKVVLIEFDVTSDNVPPIQEGYALVTVGQREYFMGYYSLWLLFNMTLAKLQGGTWEDAIKQFIPDYPENDFYDTGVDLVGVDHMEFDAPIGEKVVVLSLQEYKQLCIELGIPPELLGLENV